MEVPTRCDQSSHPSIFILCIGRSFPSSTLCNIYFPNDQTDFPPPFPASHFNSFDAFLNYSPTVQVPAPHEAMLHRALYQFLPQIWVQSAGEMTLLLAMSILDLISHAHLPSSVNKWYLPFIRKKNVQMLQPTWMKHRFVPRVSKHPRGQYGQPSYWHAKI